MHHFQRWIFLNSESHSPAYPFASALPAGGGTFIFSDTEGRRIKPLMIKLQMAFIKIFLNEPILNNSFHCYKNRLLNDLNLHSDVIIRF